MSRTGTYIEAESPLVVASAKEKCKDGGWWGGSTVLKGAVFLWKIMKLF